MLVRVTVMLKDGVRDPQGEAVRRALDSLGFERVRGARQGKLIELDVVDGTTPDEVAAMCDRLLANPVIESYRIEM